LDNPQPVFLIYVFYFGKPGPNQLVENFPDQEVKMSRGWIGLRLDWNELKKPLKQG